MRIAVHDFAGHAFVLPLSRELAARGHRVLHLYCAGLRGPRGSLARRPDDPERFEIRAVQPPAGIQKTALFRRRLQEIAYARRLAGAVDEFGPDVVLSGNAPLDAQAALLRRCRRREARFVFWAQDLIGVGAWRVLGRRWGPAGRWLGAGLRRYEARLLRHSDAVVAITDDFVPVMERLGVHPGRVRVIENWAAIDELPPRPRDNPWARRHGLTRNDVLLYSGTLGMKHDPGKLLRLAGAMAQRRAATVVVVSEGPGAERLARRLPETPGGPARANGRGGSATLQILPYQPHEKLADVLGTADVLLALLEDEAGIYSVPSKILSAMCAARPLLLAVPAENLAARTVRRAGAGLVVAPDDTEGLVREANRLLDDPALRERLGRAGRRWAEERFRTGSIATAFEDVLSGGRAGTDRGPAGG